MARPLRQSLIESVFKIDKSGENSYRCNPPHIRGNLETGIVFGGQAVCQTFRAVWEQFGKEIVPNSLHYRFIAPGNGDVPIDYIVEDLGGMIRIKIFQIQNLIGLAHCRINSDQFPSFELSPAVSNLPKELPWLGDISTKIKFPLESARKTYWEIRIAEWGRYPKTEKPRNLWWIRLRKDCKDLVSRRLGLQTVLLLSDFMIILIAEDIFFNHGYQLLWGASLSHSVRFHMKNDEIDSQDWFLYRQECEVITTDRVKVHATVFNKEKKAIISVIQEALMSMKKKNKV